MRVYGLKKINKELYKNDRILKEENIVEVVHGFE